MKRAKKNAMELVADILQNLEEYKDKADGRIQQVFYENGINDKLLFSGQLKKQLRLVSSEKLKRLRLKPTKLASYAGMTCNGCVNLIGKGCVKYGGRTSPKGFAKKCRYRDVPAGYIAPEKETCPYQQDDGWCLVIPSRESCENWYTQNAEGKWVKDNPEKRMIPTWIRKEIMCRSDRCEFYGEYF